MKKYYLITLFAALTLTSCVRNHRTHLEFVSLNDKSNIGHANYSSLIETSEELITFSSGNIKSAEQVAERVKIKHPTRAEISCMNDDHNCSHIEKVLESLSVPIKRIEVNENKINDITLVYEKSVTRNCYDDISSLMPNSSTAVAHPPLGCAVNANIMQMVSDSTQFTNPKLSGLQDACKSVKAVKRAN